MPVQNSYQNLAEQILAMNANLIESLSKLQDVLASAKQSVDVTVLDTRGVQKTVTVPSLGHIRSEIERLSNNINALSGIGTGNTTIFPAAGVQGRRVVAVDLNKEPSDISTIGPILNFDARKNWFFDALLNPQLYVEIDLTGQISDSTRKILCRRYIPEFETDGNGNFTARAQTAIASFDNKFRGKQGFSVEEYETWHLSTAGLVSPTEPNYDEQIFDTEPGILEKNGLFGVLRTEEDPIARKLWYVLDTLEYTLTATGNKGTLTVGEELLVNLATASTRYKIVEISTSGNLPKIRLERMEGQDPVPVGAGTLKIYSRAVRSKSVRISVGYSERCVAFLKSFDANTNILSKNWSKGTGFFTNDLRNAATNETLEKYYVDKVFDYGSVLKDLVAKKTPASIGVSPSAPTIVPTTFKVVKANAHLLDTVDSETIKKKTAQQKTVRAESEQLSVLLDQRQRESKTKRFATELESRQYFAETEKIRTKRDAKAKELAALSSEILELSRSSQNKAAPEYRLRGFWEIPPAVSARGSKPLETVQFKIQYRYLSKDGRESPVETFSVSDGSTSKPGAFSNWTEFKTDARKRTFDPATGQYSWAIENVSDADTPNINQLDIPIRQGERVQVRIKSLSEAGWPESPIESEWSEIATFDFPDNLANVSDESDFILREATKEELRIAVMDDISAKGIDDHLGDQVQIGQTFYAHESRSILSGKTNAAGVPLSLFDYIETLERRIALLEEKSTRAKGELEIVLLKKGASPITVKNGSEISINIECEDYMEQFSAAGVPSGKVYRNNVYLVNDYEIRLSNISQDTPLGLLSRRNYSQSTNQDVWAPLAPQVFWVNDQNELIADFSTGTTRTQFNNQFVWSVNYEGASTGGVRLAENIGNNFVAVGNNSLTSVLATNDTNLGYSEDSVLAFVGNNLSLLDPTKWMDASPSVASGEKLLSSVHPMVPNLDLLRETNNEKTKTLAGGDSLTIPLNVYFKPNALDNNKPGNNYQYVDFNRAQSTVRHIKKLRFMLENEADGRLYYFTVKFNINRTKVIANKNIATTGGQAAR